MLAPQRTGVDSRGAVGVAGHVDPGVGAGVEPVEQFADAQAAQAVAELPQVQEEPCVLLLLVRSQQRVQEFDQSYQGQKEGTFADRTDVLACVPR